MINNCHIYLEKATQIPRAEYQRLVAEGCTIEVKPNTLEYFLSTSPDAALNRCICTELLLKWSSDFAYTLPQDNFYEQVFQHAEKVYQRIFYDKHLGLHKQLFIEYALASPLATDAFLSLFIAYIWLQLGEKDWKIDMLLSDMRSTDWSTYISASPLLPGTEKERKEKINSFFQKADKIAIRSSQKGPEQKEIDTTASSESIDQPAILETVTEPTEEPPSNGKQLTNRQLVILFEMLMKRRLNSNHINVNALSRMIGAVSGKSSESIRQTIKKGFDYNRPDMKADMEVVATLLDKIAPGIAQELRNRIHAHD